MRSAGFRNVDVKQGPKNLRLPAPADFLWQQIHSTPLALAAAQAGEAKRAALEHDVCVQWQDFVVDGFLSLQVGHATTATAT